jgi:hypothetical protein
MTDTGITAQPTGPEYADIVTVLRTLVSEHSLPLWSGEGWDPASGGFVERLVSRAGIVRRRGGFASSRDRSFASPSPPTSAGILKAGKSR